MAAFNTNISTPTNVQHACHVEWDEETGTFKGLPDVWAGLVPKGTSQNETSTRAMSVIGSHVAPQKPTKKMLTKVKEKEKPMMIVREDIHIRVCTFFACVHNLPQ